MDQKRVEIIFFFVLFGGVSILTFLVFRPFLEVLILAAVAALLLEPVYKWVLPTLKYRKNLSAFFIVVIFMVFVIAPLFYVGIQIFQQTQSLYTSTQTGGPSYSAVIERIVETPIRHIIPTFTFDAHDYAVKILQFISLNFSSLLSKALGILLQTFLFLVAFFFFLRDGEEMLMRLITLSPFEHRHNQEILTMTKRTIVSVVTETVVVILIRWVLVGLGFYVCGIPNAAFWGSLAGIVGAIPSFGTPVVIIPAAMYLYSEGHVLGAVGIILVGLFIMLIVENILAPYMLGKGFDVSPLFALLSLFGGLILFGPFGLIFGPIVLSLFLSAIHMYKVLTLENRGV